MSGADPIQQLTEALASVQGDTPIYALRRLPGPPKETHNRVFGVPHGIGADRWPTSDDDEPMVHLLTLDLATMPALAERLPGARTVSLFCVDPEDNEAFEPFNEEVAIVSSTEEQVARGLLDPPTEVSSEASFEVIPLTVPSDIFAEYAEGVPEEHREIRELVYQLHGRAGGEPIWLQSAEHDGTFLLQFDEALVPGMNLGDMGLMFVFEDTAFWQCH